MNINKFLRFVLHHETPINIRIFYYLAFLVIILITVFPFFNTGIACSDDISYYIITRLGNPFSIARQVAESQGRFQYLIVNPIQYLPFLWDDIFITKIFQIIPVLFSLFLVYRILLAHTKSHELSALYILLFFITAQVSQHLSLFVNYPFYFTFSFSLLLLAYLLVLRFQEKKNYRTLVFSAILFAFGLLFYEMYILFVWFVALSFLLHNYQSGGRRLVLIKDTLLQLVPFFLVVLLFILTYIIYRQYHPSQYPGTRIAESTFNLTSFFMVLWKLSYTAFPLTVYDSMRDFFALKSELIEGYYDVVPYLFFHAHIEWVIKAVLVFILSYFLSIRIPKISYRTILFGALFSVMFIFFPHLPLALTEKYQYYVTTQGMEGYVTTFFSLFGVVLFLSILSVLLLNFTKRYTVLRHMTAFVISVGFVLCGFLTDFSNFHVTQDMHQANVRFYTVHELIKSEQFKAIPEKSNIYAADLWDNPFYMASGITTRVLDWGQYIDAKSGICQNFIQYDSTFLNKIKNSPAPGYRLIYKQGYKTDDALLILSQLKKPGSNDLKIDSVSDKVLIVFYSQYKQFSLSFKRKLSPMAEKIKINHINGEANPGEYVEMNIYNINFHKPATIFTIECPGIFIQSIRISNSFSQGNEVFYL